MKIIKLIAENYKKLKVVEITPSGHVVQVTGPNSSGKSSVLDAIYAALCGTRDLPSKPVRSGEERASIKLDLGELVVTRRFTASGGTSLTVEAQNGARFPSPQAMLDELLGRLAFDPLAFARYEPKRQLEELKKLVPLSVDVEAIDQENKRDTERRRDVGRDVRRLEAQVAQYQDVPDDLPAYKISVEALIQQINDINEQNNSLRVEEFNRKHAVEMTEKKREQASKYVKEAEDLKKKADELLKLAGDMFEAVATEEDFYRTRSPIEYKNTDQLSKDITCAQATNALIDRREARNRLIEELYNHNQEEARLTESIELRSRQKRQAIAEAKMPVDGLAFGEGELLLGGLPLSQAGSAEQLRVSVAIAMAANPKLRIIRIKDGSLLDEKGLELLSKLAVDSDYQVWVERVDTSGKVGVVMEDGEVRK